jgi:hypothetical protein
VILCSRPVSYNAQKKQIVIDLRIGSTNCKGTVENAEQKRNAGLPASQVVLLKRAPHKVVGGMLLRHGGQHNNGDNSTNDDEKCAGVLGVWHEFVGEHDDAGAEPQDEQVGNVHHPWIGDEAVLPVDGVHAHGDVGRDLQQRREIKHPAIEVKPAREEAKGPSMLLAACDCRPVVNPPGRWNRRRKLGSEVRLAHDLSIAR